MVVIVMPKTAWEMFWFTVKPYKWWMLLMWVLILVGNSLTFSIPYFLKLIVDYVSVLNGSPFLFSEIAYIFYLIIGVLVLQEISYRIAHVLDVYLNINTFDRMNSFLFGHLLDRPSAYFEDKFSGQLTQRVDQISSSIKHFVETFPWELAWAVPAVVVSATLLFIASPVLFAVFAIWFVVFWIIGYPLLKVLYLKSEKVWGTSATYSGQFVDTIGNISLVHSFAARKYERKRFAKRVFAVRSALKGEGVWFILNKFHQGFGMVLLSILLIGTSIYLFSENQLTVGDFVLVVGVLPALTNAFWFIGDLLLTMLRNWSGLSDSVAELQTAQERLSEGTSTLSVDTEVVTFENISFTYPGTSVRILDNLSLTIPAGQKMGIVGSSGAGKSTLIKLLLRHYDPDAGCVYIGQENIQEVTLASLRQALAFVPQDTTLFHRSLMENIHYARPGASIEEVFAVSKKAHAHNFIQSMSEQYETKVGERGVKLSGGQRQRIAVARAMLKNAPILILDEATSALDGESEEIVQKGFQELFAGRTVIAVAHRLSTLREMDRIIVMEGGRIVEDGAPHTLLEKEGGIFKQKWEQQKGGFVS